MINIYHEDCLVAMKDMEDNKYDLAIVDPPYGIGISSNPVRQKQVKKDWDNEIPSQEYFDELFRVSKNQIIWGGNYFPLPPTQGFLIWDKKQPENFSLAMCEYAWMSIQTPAKIFRYSVHSGGDKSHPTQKPEGLYRWVIKKYAKKGDYILDTHLGSGTIGNAVDAMNYGFGMELSFDGYEIDKGYFDNAYNRIFNTKAPIERVEGGDPNQIKFI